MKFDYNAYLLLTGIAIGIERRERNQCQEDLSEGICSTRTLRSMEKGKQVVKDHTYEALLHKLGYEFNTSAVHLEQLALLLKELHEIKACGLTAVNAKRINDLHVGNEKDICSCMMLLLLKYFYKQIQPSEQDLKLIDFICSGYPIFPPPLQDLILNYLFHYYECTNMEIELNEVVHKMELNEQRFTPHILCKLAHRANKKDYITVISLYQAVEQYWIKEKKLGSLLTAQEIILLPVLYADPNNLVKYVEKAENTLSLITERNIPISNQRMAQYSYNVGLVYTYAKQYEQAYFYLKKSCEYVVETPLLMNQILLEYVCKRLCKLNKEQRDSEISFHFHQEENPFRDEYNYFYYKKNDLYSTKLLQKYILKTILPTNRDDTYILYQVFLYEMIELSNISKSYGSLKLYVEAVNG